MIAGPIEPGVGESLYQPGFASGSSSDGTWMVPSALRPNSTSALSTPMEGTDSATGGAAGSVGAPAVAESTDELCAAAGDGGGDAGATGPAGSGRPADPSSAAAAVGVPTASTPAEGPVRAGTDGDAADDVATPGDA